MRRVRVELCCAQCGFTARHDALNLLRRAGMLKRAGDDVDQHLVTALIAAVGERLTCEQCGHTGIACRAVDEDEDELESWPTTRRCRQCGQPIPGERLRLFPQQEYCAACQKQREEGMSAEDQREFCPWCGQVLLHKATRRRGVTEYVPACPACGYSG